MTNPVQMSSGIAPVLAFLGVALVVIVTPGQDTALTIRNTLAGGRKAGVRTAAGVSLGQSIWALAATAGLTALLRASEPAFLAFRLAGAAYLVYLGALALRSARAARPATFCHAAARRSARACLATSATRKRLCSLRASCRSSATPSRH
jgi:threonine/homoserine/homoserine lactone efflux protein